MATVYDKSSLFLAPSGVNNGTVFTQKPFPIYGPELVTNGDFATDSDWTKGGGATISGGKANIVGDGSTYVSIQQNSVFTTGKKYRVSADVEINSGLGLKFQDGATNENIGFATSSGTYVFDFIAGSNTSLVVGRRTGGTAFNSSVDNISVKEISNDADFDFSRGSNLSATRVNADGLIEKGRENIVLHSNDFSQSSWAKLNGASVSSTRVADPFGGTDAWELTFATNNDSRIQQQVTTVNNTVYAFSVWARVTSGTKIVNLGAVGNLQQKTLTTTWQRIQAYAKETDVYGFPQIRKHSAEGEYTIQIYGFQLELGTVATDYIESTVATGKAGILENTPRLDYSGGATCPSLLLEPSRTQLIPYSEYLGSWTSGTFTPIISSVTSPEGVNNAYTLPFTNSAGSNIYTFATLSSTNEHIFSIYAKVGSGTKTFRVRAEYGGTSVTSSDFTATSTWQRFEFAFNPTATNIVAYIFNGSNGEDSDLEVYGIQVEQGSYPTSYIPNHSGGSVTRARDTSPAQYYNYSTLNNYTLFFDFNLTNQPFLQNVVSKNIRSQSLSGNTMTWRWFHTGGSHCFVPYFNLDATYPFSTNVAANRTDNGKVVMSVSGGTYKLFLRFDGTTTMQTTTGKTAAPFNRFNLMQDGQKERINQIVFFDTTLSDIDCEILTGATTYETFEEMALALNYTVYE